MTDICFANARDNRIQPMLRVSTIDGVGHIESHTLDFKELSAFV